MEREYDVDTAPSKQKDLGGDAFVIFGGSRVITAWSKHIQDLH
jgi:hypothetical protein